MPKVDDPVHTIVKEAEGILKDVRKKLLR